MRRRLTGFGFVDAVIHVRINNDDRNLRRLLKKFYLYTSAASSLRKKADTSQVAEEARDAFLLDLATLSVQSRKNVLVCEAELRQIEEYERETSQIGAFKILGLLNTGVDIPHSSVSG